MERREAAGGLTMVIDVAFREANNGEGGAEGSDSRASLILGDEAPDR